MSSSFYSRINILNSTKKLYRAVPLHSQRAITTTASMAVPTTHARNTSNSTSKPHPNIKTTHHHTAHRSHHTPTALTDYDTTASHETRKYLKTYGLTPPGIDTFETQSQRCMAVLKSRKTPIEKYQYLSVLRNTNMNLFYRLLAANVKVSHGDGSPVSNG